jgi:2-dehydro-3-deoxygalactonokinase
MTATCVADWIAVDWGTSRMRAWAMGTEGVVASGASEEGMNTLAPDEFEAALLRVIDPWLGDGLTTVLACGMVGSRQGWQEAAYVPAPAALDTLRPERVRSVRDPRLSVHIVPGLRQENPADIMRGEETQIAGFLVQEPDFDGVLCLPGTHTKWVRISAREVVGFQTFMTGEMFDLLAEHSILRHSVKAGALDGDAFDAAVRGGLSEPERLMRSLFSIRAEGTLAPVPAHVARARLSGTLIGAELAAARGYWLGHDIAVAGAPALCDLYARALKGQGVPARAYDADPLTQAGLMRLHRQMMQGAAR